MRFDLDSGSVEGKLGMCVVAMGENGSWQGVKLGDLTEMVANPIMVPVHCTVHSHNPTQWNIAMNTCHSGSDLH